MQTCHTLERRKSIHPFEDFSHKMLSFRPLKNASENSSLKFIMGFEKKFEGSKMLLKLANLINKVLLKSGLDFFGIEKCCFVCQSLEDSC